MPYILLKFVHVTSVIVWLGCAIALTTLNFRLAGQRDRALLLALARQSEFLGARVMGPAAGMTLLAGIAALVVGRMGFPFWAGWGLGAMVLSMALGGALIGRTGARLIQLLTAGDASDAEVDVLQRRIGRLQLLNILILLSAVWVMVAKPVP
jgi:uncharacterized membrane protein